MKPAKVTIMISPFNAKGLQRSPERKTPNECRTNKLSKRTDIYFSNTRWQSQLVQTGNPFSQQRYLLSGQLNNSRLHRCRPQALECASQEEELLRYGQSCGY